MYTVTTTFPFALVANSHRISKLVDACNPQLRERHEGGLPNVGHASRTEAIAQQRASSKRMSLIPGEGPAVTRRDSELVVQTPGRKASMTPRLPAIHSASQSPRGGQSLASARTSQRLATRTPRQPYDLGSAP